MPFIVLRSLQFESTDTAFAEKVSKESLKFMLISKAF